MDMFDIFVTITIILMGIKFFNEKCTYSWTIVLSPLIGPIIFNVLLYAISSALKCGAVSFGLFF